MSSLPPSLVEAAGSEPGPNLRSVLSFLHSAQQLTATQRRDLISAVTRVVEWIGLPAEGIPTSLRWLSKALFHREPEVSGVSASTHRTVCSRLRKALREMGLHAALVRGEGDIGPQWLAFLSSIERKHSRIALRGIARWCDKCGIVPQSLNQASFLEFLSQDADSRLSSSASTIHRVIARSWNLARSFQPDPERYVELVPPRIRDCYTHPFEWYLPSFQEDVEALQKAISRVGPPTSAADGTKRHGRFMRYSSSLEEARRRIKKPVRATTVRSRLFSLRQAAAALIHEGVPREELKSLRDLVTPFARINLILDFFDQRAKDSPVQLTMIASALLLVARHHARLSEDECDELFALMKEARGKRQKGLTFKNRQRLTLLRDPHRQEKLRRLPETLMERARASKGTPTEAARLARGAAIFQVLLACPLRISNVRNLRIGTELVRMTAGSMRFSHILIRGADTKTGSEVAWPINDRAAQIIGRYVRDFRPALAHDGNAYLFPGTGTEPLSDSGIRTIFMKIAEREVGAVVNPHLMRHNAAHAILDMLPGNYGAASRALQHDSVKTTTDAYTGLETDSTADIVDEAMIPSRSTRRRVRKGRG